MLDAGYLLLGKGRQRVRSKRWKVTAKSAEQRPGVERTRLKIEIRQAA